ncbi:MAG: hypothetical protein ABFS34_02700 [Gemmatimonadota bacterium]
MRLHTGVMLGALLLSACGDDPIDPLADFEPQISNATDNFQLQASNVQDVTATLDYSWENTGTSASVDHSTTLSAGSARVIVKDASGAKVYDAALEASKNEDTAAGSSGTWTVSLVLVNYDGTLNFRVQKK